MAGGLVFRSLARESCRTVNFEPRVQHLKSSIRDTSLPKVLHLYLVYIMAVS